VKTREFANVSQAAMSLTSVETIISAYRAWIGQLLTHFSLILSSVSPIIVL